MIPTGAFDYLAFGQIDTTTFTYTAYDENGGSDTATVTITITGENDAPTLDTSGDLTLPEVDRTDNSPPGTSVRDILESGGADIIDDVDMFDPEGIAIVSANETDGLWQFSINGTDWTDLTSISSSNAVLLGTSSLLRFIPDAGGSVSTSSIQFHAWDHSFGFDGDTGVDLSAWGTGGSTAFSDNIETATVAIVDTPQNPVAVNDNYEVDEDTTLSVSSNWWNFDWSSRRTLTFDNTTRAENLTDFPILVELNASRIDYSQTQTNGEDLRFVDGDGTVLDYEIEEWNPSGTSLIWVKVPQIDANSGTDFIYMYYGNNTAVDAQNASAVWSSDNEAVYHLNENPGASGTFVDSTGNYNATNVGTTNDTTGAIGAGQSFNGTDQYINIGENLPLIQDVDAVTLSAWVYSSDITQTAKIVGVSNGSTDPTSISRASIEVVGPEVRITGRTVDNVLALPFTTNSSPLMQDQWQLITAVIDYTGDTLSIYVDGVLERTTPTIFVGDSASSDARNSGIGANEDGSGSFFEGSLDEVRITDIAASAEWINAQHASMTDALTSFSSEESWSILNNDSDPNDDSITAVLVAGPTNSQSFQLFVDGTFTYTPDDDFFGTDTFTYQAFDGTNSSNIATVTITVNSVNDPPAFITNQLTIDEGETVTLTAANLEVSDIDHLDTQLTISVDSVSNGMFVDKDSPTTEIASFTMQDIRDGEIQFVHNGSENAPAYSLSVSDGTISIGPDAALIDFRLQNDTPIITAPVNESSPKNGSVTFSATTLNAISISDDDALAGIMRVELTATDGTITLGNAGVVNVISDTGNSVIIEGSLANLNTALEGTIFSPTSGFSGTGLITGLCQ